MVLSISEKNELTEELKRLMSCDNRDELLPTKTLDTLWDIEFNEGGVLECDGDKLSLIGDNGIAVISLEDLCESCDIVKSFILRNNLHHTLSVITRVDVLNRRKRKCEFLLDSIEIGTPSLKHLNEVKEIVDGILEEGGIDVENPPLK